MWFGKRQAALKREYTDWYPWITPGAWYRVRKLMTLVQRQQDRTEPHWELPPRILSDEHFRFRGGNPIRRPHQRRLTDLIFGMHV